MYQKTVTSIKRKKGKTLTKKNPCNTFYIYGNIQCLLIKGPSKLLTCKKNKKKNKSAAHWERGTQFLEIMSQQKLSFDLFDLAFSAHIVGEVFPSTFPTNNL